MQLTMTIASQISKRGTQYYQWCFTRLVYAEVRWRMLLSDSNFLRLLVQFWRDEDMLNSRVPYGSQALVECANVSHTMNSLVLEAVCGFMEHERCIAKFALDRVKRALLCKSAHRDFLAASLEVVVLLSGNALTREYVLREDGMETVFDVVTRGVETLRSDRTANALILHAYQFFVLVLESATVEQVHQAIDVGLLQSFACLRPVFDTFQEATFALMRRLLRKILPQFLIYPRILDAALAALKNLNDVPPKCATSSDDRIAEDWATLKAFSPDTWRLRRSTSETYRHRARRFSAVMFATFSYSERRFNPGVSADRRHFSCTQSICGSYASRQSFKKCAGCERAVYCSKECQRVSWKAADGHKESCPTMSDNEFREPNGLYVYAMGRKC